MESLHYLLMKAHTMLNRQIITRAQEIGLSPGQPKVLEYLLLHGENNQKAIADFCEIEPATVGNILLRMEQAGLITRSNREGNRRSLYVTLTPLGWEAALGIERIFQAQEQLASADMTGEEVEQLRVLLDKFCRSALREAGDQV